MQKMDVPDIPAFYAGRTVLVTGGTGFMGKVLVEKMLRSLPDIKRVIVLCRPKRGTRPQARIDAITKLPLYDRLRAENPSQIKKLQDVEGDILQPDLGIVREDDRQMLLNEVSVVFHMAAYLRLEAGMRDAVRHNLTGTKRVLDFCTGMKNLVCFTHLSTAFCHVDVDELEERVYDPPADPDIIMRLLGCLNDSSLEAITPQLLGKHPNCYTYSKRLAESLVEQYRDKMPLVIVRPSIVTPSFKEPMPGWVDSLNGPIGLVVGAGKGVIRSLLCERNFHAEVVPVDIAANALIIFGWWRHEHVKERAALPAFNVSQSAILRITWGEVLDTGRSLIYEYPFEGAAWYPDGDLRTSKVAHNLLVFFFQIIPAYFIDFIMYLTRQKLFMVRVQKRILVGLEVLQYFTMREWNFNNKTGLTIESLLTPGDRECFFVSNLEIDVLRYMKDALLGARVYCMKEPLSSLPRARRHMKMLHVIHRFSVTMFWVLLAWLAFRIVSGLGLVPSGIPN